MEQNHYVTLTTNDIGMIKWYVDASYAIYDGCHGHTGAMIAFGSGAVTSFLQKQKLNAKSSTEAELIGVDDAMPQILWTLYFLKHQGYDILSTTLFQDTKHNSCDESPVHYNTVKHCDLPSQ